MKNLLVTLAALATSIAAIAAVAALLGRSPVTVLSVLAEGGLGSSYALSESIVKAVPLLLTALSILVAFRCGVWNIGAEGQFIAGGVAAFIAARIPGPPFLVCPIALIAAIAGGSAWAGIAIWLKLHRNAPEVLTTILLNFVAIHLLGYAVTGPLQESAKRYPQSEAVPTAALLPAIGGSRLHAGLIVALLAALLCWRFLHHSSAGLRLRAVGANPRAAAWAGINVPREIARATLVSGGLAGLAGGIELLGVTHRLFERFAAGHGYSGIAVALVAQLHPLGAIASALLFGTFSTGAGELQRGGEISASVAVLLQGIVVFALLVATAGRVSKLFGRKTSWS